MKQHQSIQCEDNKLPLHMPIFDANLDLVSEVPLDLDRTVGQTSASNPKIVAGIYGKGISKNYKEIREENVVLSKMTMAKNPWLVVPVVLLAIGIVAGGILIWQMYPLSTAALSTRVVADKVMKDLKSLQANLWNKFGLFTKLLCQGLRVMWLALFKSRMLENSARAIKLQGFLGLTQAKPVVSFCFRLVEGLQKYIRLMLLGVIDAVQVSIKSIHSDMMELIADIKLEHVRVILLASVLPYVEMVRLNAKLVISGVTQLFKWLVVKVNTQGVNLVSRQVVAPLMTQQAAVQNIGKTLIVRETQALRDVKYFEERRIAIASATDSLLDNTRSVALNNILKMKMAAMDFIHERAGYLADEYVKVLEQAIKDYELILCQIKVEVGSKILDEMLSESKEHIDAAVNLKRDLSVHGQTDIDFAFGKELQNKLATEIYHVDVQLVEESTFSECVTKVSSLEEQILADSMTEPHIRFQFASGRVEQTEDEARDKSILGETVKGVYVNEDQDPIVCVELSELFVSVDKLTEDAFETDTTSDQKHTIAELDNKHYHDATAKSEAVDTMKKTLVPEVAVDFGNAVSGMELVHELYLIEARNVSGIDADKQEIQQHRGEAHLKASVKRTGLMDIDAIGETINFEQVDMIQTLANRRTHDAAQVDNEKGESIENHKEELTMSMQENSIEGFLAGETERKLVDAEAVLNFEVGVAGAKKVIIKLPDTDGDPAQTMHIYEDSAVVQIGKLDVTGEARQECARGFEENANTVTLTDAKILESEAVAMEIHEMELLERTSLQQEGERFDVESELRIIAKEEGILLHNDQTHAEGKTFGGEAPTSEQLMIATIGVMDTSNVTTDLKNENGQSRFNLTLMRVGLFTVAFLGLAAITAYLIARHQKKRGFVAQAPRHRPKRWQRLVSMAKSQAEEVVLLPGDCSEEGDETDIVETKRFAPKVTIANDVKKAIDFGSVEDFSEEEDINANHKVVEEKERTVREEGRESVENRSERTRSSITVRVQTIHLSPNDSVNENF
ncbi:hypothetical protein PsorP6_004868 [Peronosclerospora sorghi]|uniref:Uncharacterized protein n=1 Tax=Peronosclerospora sorghi TaxID=230839 RepID=A0ACC0W326_9STRA|nr:hypothetical protein PsorP6_004868 [Peronosclerospora sorghi]